MSGETIKLQANIGGFGNSADAVMVLGELLLDSQILLIDAAVKVRPGQVEKRIQDCAVVSNNPATEDRDALFAEANLRQAVGDYFDFKARNLLELDGDARQYDPETGIEMDGIDERGRKYRFNSSITNGQVAVLVLCWFAQEQVRSRQAAREAQNYADMQGSMFSVGMAVRSGSRGPAVTSINGVPIAADGWPL